MGTNRDSDVDTYTGIAQAGILFINFTLGTEGGAIPPSIVPRTRLGHTRKLDRTSIRFDLESSEMSCRVQGEETLIYAQYDPGQSKSATMSGHEIYLSQQVYHIPT